MRYYILILLFIPFTGLGQSNKSIHLSCVVRSNKLTHLALYKFGVTSDLGNFKLDTSVDITPYKHNSFDIMIPSKGMYAIEDGITSHSVFLKPGDKISITFYPVNNYLKQLQGNHPILTRHIIQVRSRFPGNLLFFDSISRVLPIKFEMLKNPLPLVYKKQCDSVYNIWMNLLKHYIKAGMVSNDFIPYAKSEIAARYITWVTSIFRRLPRDKIPNGYLSGIDTFSFNKSKYSQSLQTYITAAHCYNTCILNQFNPYKPYSNLENEFQTILQKYTGEMRDELMAEEILDYLGKKNPLFDSVYMVFINQCHNTDIKRFVVNKVNAYSLVSDNLKIHRNKWENVQERTILFTANNKTIILKDLLMTNKLSIIDCWASWCGPCREQIPFLKNIEEKMGDSVQFISLSFDKDERLWKVFLHKHLPFSQNQYRIFSVTDTAFKNYFNLYSIPRYILISKSGEQVLDPNMPVPSLTNDFIRTVRKYLK